MINRTIKLPDYTAAFRTGDVRPLHFRARNGSNFVHDVHFLSGYLHDARVLASKVKLQRGRLALEVHRDCWEIGYKHHRDCVELYTALAQLVISPVFSVRWEISEFGDLAKPFWINSIYLGADHWETIGKSELIISSGATAGIRLRVGIGADYGIIRLDDLAIPTLHKPKSRCTADHKKNNSRLN